MLRKLPILVAAAALACASAAAAASPPALPAHGKVVGDRATFLQLAQQGIAQTRQLWWNSDKGWYNDRLNDDDHLPLATLWSAYGLFEALDAAAIADPSKANKRAVTAFASYAEKYWDPNIGKTGAYVYYPTVKDSGWDAYMDDNAWWGLAFLDAYRATVGAARARGAAVHLDGARLLNASVAAGVEPSAWASLADTVTVCFSKGLGCPFGAVLAGSAETIERAWEGKFLLGGALRQSGVAAAAMLYALDHHIDRLADDHARAKRLAEGIGIDPATVETNFVPIPDEPGLTERLLEHDVRVGGLRPGWLRAVTHLDVGEAESDTAIERMREVVQIHA